jgi:hypothetical protein
MNPGILYYFLLLYQTIFGYKVWTLRATNNISRHTHVKIYAICMCWVALLLWLLYKNKLEHVWKRAPSKYANNNTRTTTKGERTCSFPDFASNTFIQGNKKNKKSDGKEQGTDMFWLLIILCFLRSRRAGVWSLSTIAIWLYKQMAKFLISSVPTLRVRPSFYFFFCTRSSNVIKTSLQKENVIATYSVSL